MAKNWTQKEIRYLISNAEYKTYFEIGFDLGRTEMAVIKKATNIGLRKYNPKKKADEEFVEHQNKKELDEYEKAIVIEGFVSAYFNLSQKETYFRTRKRNIVMCRQILHYALKNLTILSLDTIGKMSMRYGIDKFDHATVLHSIKTVNNLKTSDRKYREIVDYFEETIPNLIHFAIGDSVSNIKLNIIKALSTHQTEEGLKIAIEGIWNKAKDNEEAIRLIPVVDIEELQAV